MAKLEDPGWRASLMEEVAGLWKDRKLCDMVIVSKDGQRFSAHSIILSAASPVLKEMIAGGNREITFDQSSSETCSALLNFIYTGELLFDEAMMTLKREFQATAKAFRIPSLCIPSHPPGELFGQIHPFVNDALGSVMADKTDIKDEVLNCNTLGSSYETFGTILETNETSTFQNMPLCGTSETSRMTANCTFSESPLPQLDFDCRKDIKQESVEMGSEASRLSEGDIDSDGTEEYTEGDADEGSHMMDMDLDDHDMDQGGGASDHASSSDVEMASKSPNKYKDTGNSRKDTLKFPHVGELKSQCPICGTVGLHSRVRRHMYKCHQGHFVQPGENERKDNHRIIKDILKIQHLIPYLCVYCEDDQTTRTYEEYKLHVLKSHPNFYKKEVKNVSRKQESDWSEMAAKSPNKFKDTGNSRKDTLKFPHVGEVKSQCPLCGIISIHSRVRRHMYNCHQGHFVEGENERKDNKKIIKDILKIQHLIPYLCVYCEDDKTTRTYEEYKLHVWKSHPNFYKKEVKNVSRKQESDWSKMASKSTHNFKDTGNSRKDTLKFPHVGEVKSQCPLCGTIGLHARVRRHMYKCHQGHFVGGETDGEDKAKELKIRCLSCQEEVVRQDYAMHLYMHHAPSGDRKTNSGRHFKVNVGCLYCDCSVKNADYMDHLESVHPEVATELSEDKETSTKPREHNRIIKDILKIQHLIPYLCVYCEDDKTTRTYEEYKLHVWKSHPNFYKKEVKNTSIVNVKSRLESGWAEKRMSEEKLEKTKFLFIDRSRNLPDLPPPPSEFKCFLCQYICRSKKDYFQHAKEVHGFKTKRISACNFCNQLFKTGSDRQNHEDEVHAIEKYFCDICGKDYVRSSSLKIHKESVHLGAMKESLLKHKRKPQTLLCSECGASFGSGSALNYHVATKHVKEQNFVCLQCGKTFCHAGQLRKHALIHSNEKKFACNLCSYKTNRRHVLESHLRIHTGERPYKCDLCEARFRIGLTLRWHLEKKHGVFQRGKTFERYLQPEESFQSKASRILESLTHKSDEEV